MSDFVFQAAVPKVKSLFEFETKEGPQKIDLILLFAIVLPCFSLSFPLALECSKGPQQ